MSHQHPAPALFVFASLTLGIVIKTLFALSTKPNKNQPSDEENTNTTPSSRIPRIVDAVSEEKPSDRAWRQTQRFLEEQEQKLDTLHRELNTLMDEIKCIPSSEEKKRKKKKDEEVNGEEEEEDSDGVDVADDVGKTPARNDASKTLISTKYGFNSGSKLPVKISKTVIKTSLLLHHRHDLCSSNCNSKSHLVSLSPATIITSPNGDRKNEQGARIATESLDILTGLLEQQGEGDDLIIPVVDSEVIEKLKENAVAMRRRSDRVAGRRSHKLILGEGKVVEVGGGGDFGIAAA